jgi:hypothetical protein
MDEKIMTLLKGLTEKERDALQVAVSALCDKASDSSAYVSSLWGVVIAIIGDNLDEEGVNIENILNVLDPDLMEEEDE